MQPVVTSSVIFKKVFTPSSKENALIIPEMQEKVSTQAEMPRTELNAELTAEEREACALSRGICRGFSGDDKNLQKKPIVIAERSAEE